MYLSSLLQQNPSNDQVRRESEEISQLFKDTLFGSTAQVTSKSSNRPIEQFVDSLFKNWQSMMKFQGPLDIVTDPHDKKETLRLLTVLREASKKTFHSCAIMRYLVVTLVSIGNYSEALDAFNTYTAYQEKARIRLASFSSTNGSLQNDSISFGDDDKSVVRVFAKAIDLIVIVKKDGVLAKQTADRLSRWLNNENLIGSHRKTKSKHEKVGSIISADLSDGFALVWASIGRAYALYASQANTSDERQQAYQLAVSAYENSLNFHPDDIEFYFNFALLLAENGQLSKSLSVAKEALLIDNQKYQLWHLIGLLLAAMEDYEKSLQAVGNAMDILAAKPEEFSSLPDFEKEQFLQLKMSEIAVLEASEGIDTALELIPDVFSLYGALHPNVEAGSGNNNSTSNEPDVYTEKEGGRVSPARSRKFKLTPTFSRSTIRSHRDDVNGHAISGHNRHASVIPPMSSTTDGIAKSNLHSLWVWTASLYRRGGLLEDARESLAEAYKLKNNNSNIYVEQGLLFKLNNEPVLALKEFESALEKDGYNPRAIVGFVQLIHEQSELESSPLFMDENDKLAAVTRAHGLLELLVQSGRGFNCSEAWYLMSIAKESEGDTEGAKAALWRCVELEETRSVRSFKVLSF